MSPGDVIRFRCREHAACSIRVAGAPWPALLA
jgi:hypothetical protein